MLILENAREFFSSAHGLYGENSESKFYHQFANMIPDTIDVENLILAFKIAFNDAREREEEVTAFISIVPNYISRYATPEFAKEFRKQYYLEILGITQEELPNADYGYIEVEPGVIDISSKNCYAVFAALYNASKPVGAGFIQYNPMTLTQEMGEYLFNKFGKRLDNGEIYFSWVVGRPLMCTFDDNLVYVNKYNINNEEGLGQRAIATCPNVGVIMPGQEKTTSKKQ